MPYPDKPEVSTSYTAHERSHPDQSFPGQEIDVDFSALVAADSAIIDFLKNIARSDGALANGIVTADSLSPGLSIPATVADGDYGDVIIAGGAWSLDPVLVATLKDRSNHTGTQLAATISDFSSAVAALITGKQDTLGFTPENTAQKGAAGGYAELDGTGKVPLGQIPAISAVVADGDYGDISISGTGTVFTVDTGAVTYAKMQATALGNVLLGKSGAAGTIGEIQVGLNNWVGRGSSGNLTLLSPDGTTLEFSGATLQVIPGTFAAAAHTHSDATTSVAGFMSAADKTKLDGVATGATANLGDVVGPASATDNAVARFNLTTGKLIQNSGVLIDDNGKLLGVTGSTATATFNVPPGAAPTTPVNGDMWSTSTGFFVRVNGATVGPLRSGDVAGPASATDNAIARFDLTTGKILQNSSATIDDNGKIVGPVSSTTTAPVNIPPGAAPTTPVNGDVWSTSTGLFVRINGATVGPLRSGDTVGPASATDNAIARFDLATGKLLQNSGVTIDDSGKVIGVAGTTATATINIPHGAAPTTPVNGDVWSTTAGLFVRVNGATVGPLGTGGGGGGSGQTVLTSTSTGTQDDWNPGTLGSDNLLIWSGTSPVIVTGFVAGAANASLEIQNDGDTAMVFAYDFSTSTAANRVSWPAAIEHLVLFPGEVMKLRYSSASSRWIVREFPSGPLRIGSKYWFQAPMTNTPTGSGGHNALGGTITSVQSSQNGSDGREYLDTWSVVQTAASAGAVSGSRSAVGSSYATGLLLRTTTRFALGNESPLPGSADTNFIGMFASSTGPGNVDWGALTTGMIGMGRDPADSDRPYIMHAANGAAATKVDLGASFNRDSEKMYEMFVYMAPSVATPTVVVWLKSDLTVLPQAYKITTNVYTGTSPMYVVAANGNRAAAASYVMRYGGWELWR